MCIRDRAHTANTVTYNLPDAGASARGAVTTGTQTLAGAKTFSGLTAISNSTASTSSSNGALTVAGGIGIGANSTTNGSFLFTGATALVPTTGGTGTLTHNPQQIGLLKQGTTAGSSHDGEVQLNIQDSNGVNSSYLKVASAGVVISNTTASTSKTTGALKVSGGLGVAGQAVVNAIAAVGAGTAGNTSGNRPYLATKLITGTTGAVGSVTTVAHGITATNILGYTCIVDYKGSGDSVAPAYNNAAYQFYLDVNATNVSVTLGASATSITSKTFKCLIQYTA